jgi:phosphoribosylaminoimidazolecarboxamide formyltransferase/IMP cyclohydrolase
MGPYAAGAAPAGRRDRSHETAVRRSVPLPLSTHQPGEVRVKERPIGTALVSVTDKTGLTDLAAALRERGAVLLASSGTQAFLEKNGFAAEEIASYTGSRELLGGRVKTLHPKIHAGILADRDDPEHLSTLEREGIRPIDLVVVNLYPFREKRLEKGITEKDLCEFIDIGGITLIRAAAKNYHHVAVVTSPEQYRMVADEIRSLGGTTLDTRRVLAREAFRLTTSYDTAIETFFSGMTREEGLPAAMPFAFDRAQELRYGENPHQQAALYRGQEDSFLLSLVQHQGKELSFNNYLDITGAFLLARDLGDGCAAIIKHTNPCGAAWGGTPLAMYQRALQCDPVSAFGGIVALNGEIDAEAAEAMGQLFLEVIIARSYGEDALRLFSKKKNLRVVTVPDGYWRGPSKTALGLMVEGALLYQESDSGFPELESMTVVTTRQPTEQELYACRMAWKVAKNVKSNAIVIGDGAGTVGIGAGQMSRIDSARIAVEKARSAGLELAGTAAASDAFFPFPDGVMELAENGVRAVIQPGGSIKDREVIEAADAAGISMVFTGRRHFRHL